MAIKDWTTNFPTLLDTDTELPSLVNFDDDTRASQINTVKSILVNLESIVGIPEWTAASGTLRGKINKLENTVASGIYTGHMEDSPPTTANSKSDEFDGTSLDAKWTWGGAGAPSGGNETWGVADGRLYVRIDTDVGGDGAHQTIAHVLTQPVPSGDWTITSKMKVNRRENYNRFGIWARSSDANHDDVIQLVLGYSGSQKVFFDYRNNSTWTYEQGSIAWIDNQAVLRIAYVSGTNTYTMSVSMEGTVFRSLGTYNPAWYPSVFGLLFFSNTSSNGPFIASAEWFRVT